MSYRLGSRELMILPIMIKIISRQSRTRRLAETCLVCWNQNYLSVWCNMDCRPSVIICCSVGVCQIAISFSHPELSVSFHTSHRSAMRMLLINSFVTVSDQPVNLFSMPSLDWLIDWWEDWLPHWDIKMHIIIIILTIINNVAVVAISLFFPLSSNNPLLPPFPLSHVSCSFKIFVCLSAVFQSDRGHVVSWPESYLKPLP